MKFNFSKYQATGNDFVLVDNTMGRLSFTKEQIQKICDRKFGVGADGIMLIERHPVLDFDIVYFNSDGSPSLCGNGSRAAVKMAFDLGLFKDKTVFNAFDGQHEAEILPSGIVKLKMNDVRSIQFIGDDAFIHTGSPHVVRYVFDVLNFPVLEEGKKIRYDPIYGPGGTNANFVELLENNTLFVRTYERGVEDETLSCGTGITAVALAASRRGYHSPLKIQTRGGNLEVAFEVSQQGTFHQIFLIGPAKMVFEGSLEL